MIYDDIHVSKHKTKFESHIGSLISLYSLNEKQPQETWDIVQGVIVDGYTDFLS